MSRSADSVRRAPPAPAPAGSSAARVAVLLATALVLAACSGERVELSEAAQRGRGTYNAVCIACHNPDPNLPGTLGPAVAGSSRQLLEARVLRGEYPPGYTPKTDSNAMPAFPQLADRIGDLHAFLQESAD